MILNRTIKTENENVSWIFLFPLSIISKSGLIILWILLMDELAVIRK
jgi:hypothetical protein